MYKTCTKRDQFGVGSHLSGACGTWQPEKVGACDKQNQTKLSTNRMLNQATVLVFAKVSLLEVAQSGGRWCTLSET